jgi:hypothetical protein
MTHAVSKCTPEIDTPALVQIAITPHQSTPKAPGQTFYHMLHQLHLMAIGQKAEIGLHMGLPTAGTGTRASLAQFLITVVVQRGFIDRPDFLAAG